jgi:hypothetical protein
MVREPARRPVLMSRFAEFLAPMQPEVRAELLAAMVAMEDAKRRQELATRCQRCERRGLLAEDGQLCSRCRKELVGEVIERLDGPLDGRVALRATERRWRPP